MKSRSLLPLLLLFACGDKDDTGAATSATTTAVSADPSTACVSTCSDLGFSDGSAEVYDHEVNCTCSGGSGAMTDTACSDLCTDLGWSSSEAYSTEACQCSDG